MMKEETLIWEKGNLSSTGEHLSWWIQPFLKRHFWWNTDDTSIFLCFKNIFSNIAIFKNHALNLEYLLL